MLRIWIRDPMLVWTWDPDHGSGMEKNPDPGSGMNIPDLIFENWESVFWVKKNYLHFWCGSGSWIFSTLDPGWKKVGSGIPDKYLGSALPVLSSYFLDLIPVPETAWFWFGSRYIQILPFGKNTPKILIKISIIKFRWSSLSFLTECKHIGRTGSAVFHLIIK